MTTPPGSDDPQRVGNPGPVPGGPWGPPPQHAGGDGPPAPPQWGTGPGTAPRQRDRKRTVLIAALVAVALAIAAGVALLVYVLSSTRLDPERVERDVAAQFEEQHRVAIDLECDRVMVVRVGADHECEGTTADGEDIELLIVIIDEEGNYTWSEDD